MPATIVNGKAIADVILNNLKVQIDALGYPLHLAAVCVGDDPGLQAFVKLKQKAAQSIGVEFSSYFFDGKNKEEVVQALQYLAADETINGIFIELPLPDGWTDELIALIPREKDVDALTKLPIVPEPAVLALQYVFHEYGIAPRGMSAAVIGQGRLVGKPITRWLQGQGARVSAMDVDTSSPADISNAADLVVTGTGVPGLVTGDWIKDDAVVIDFGYGKTKNGTYAGDVDAESVAKKAKLLTPVPGGMGPLLIAAVLENLLELALRHAQG